MSEMTGPQSRPTDEEHAATAASARVLTEAAMERLLQRIAQGADAGEGEGDAGSEYLLFACGEVPCAVALTDLREVLLTLPTVVPVPFSPPWLLGLFPLRTDLLGLVDPAPFILASDLREPDGTRNLTTALIGEHDGVPLGLAITAVGDIALVPSGALVPLPASDRSPVAAPYAVGRYTSPQDGTVYTVVAMPRLVADLLDALRKDAAP